MNIERHIRHNGKFIDASFHRGAFTHYVAGSSRYANANLAKMAIDLEAQKISHRKDYTNGIITAVTAI